jgi:prepilin-type N-terminal cleavage/methylation domain-containing protein
MNTFQTTLDDGTQGKPAQASRRPSFNHRRDHAFTLIELLVVIGIIALLAGLVIGLTAYSARKMREHRVRTELDELVTAIEAFHAHFGHYPPDNVVSRNPLIVNPVTNQLFYELTGVIADDKGARFRPSIRQQWISSGTVKTFFNTEGFVNAGPTDTDIKAFIKLKSSQYREINTPNPDIEVLNVPVEWPRNDPRFPPPISTPDPRVKQINPNPWRYVSTQPTNNPQSFDLWAEYVDGKKIKIICNWSKDLLEK